MTRLLLLNRVDFRSGQYPSSILRAGVSEYEQSFSDEWEKEGGRFGPGSYTIRFLNGEMISRLSLDQRTLW